jgi:hypothetical protein
MSALFEGAADSTNHTDYWLTASTGNQTLIFTFESGVNVAVIRVCATTYLNPNRRSNYRITVKTQAGAARVVTDGFVDTAADSFGLFHSHEVRMEAVVEIRFDLTQEGSYGVCLKKIEIWVV